MDYGFAMLDNEWDEVGRLTRSACMFLICSLREVFVLHSVCCQVFTIFSFLNTGGNCVESARG
jgi:hypothetical protein